MLSSDGNFFGLVYVCNFFWEFLFSDCQVMQSVLKFITPECTILSMKFMLFATRSVFTGHTWSKALQQFAVEKVSSRCSSFLALLYRFSLSLMKRKANEFCSSNKILLSRFSIGGSQGEGKEMENLLCKLYFYRRIISLLIQLGH